MKLSPTRLAALRLAVAGDLIYWPPMSLRGGRSTPRWEDGRDGLPMPAAAPNWLREQGLIRLPPQDRPCAKRVVVVTDVGRRWLTDHKEP